MCAQTNARAVEVADRSRAKLVAGTRSAPLACRAHAFHFVTLKGRRCLTILLALTGACARHERLPVVQANDNTAAGRNMARRYARRAAGGPSGALVPAVGFWPVRRCPGVRGAWQGAADPRPADSSAHWRASSRSRSATRSLIPPCDCTASARDPAEPPVTASSWHPVKNARCASAAGEPGTYLYRATAGRRGLGVREREQLAGAFVVDSAQGGAADRVFVINIWGDAVRFRHVSQRDCDQWAVMAPHREDCRRVGRLDSLALDQRIDPSASDASARLLLSHRCAR